MTTARKAHYLQHVAFEGLGYIKDWLQQNNFELTATEFYKPGYQLPDPDQLDILIVMGGPMGIYDQAAYPWLTKEKAFIKNCIDKGVKVLGICLGAQLIAGVLGARVHPATHKEIGWYDLQLDQSQLLTEQTVKPADAYLHSFLQGLFQDDRIVFHWHGDQFELPPGWRGLLRTKANINQAFTFQSQVLALQFHLEVTQETLMAMLRHGEEELLRQDAPGGIFPYIQTKGDIIAGGSNIGTCHQLLRRILDNWWL